jgi:hypothetical protein
VTANIERWVVATKGEQWHPGHVVWRVLVSRYVFFSFHSIFLNYYTNFFYGRHLDITSTQPKSRPLAVYERYMSCWHPTSTTPGLESHQPRLVLFFFFVLLPANEGLETPYLEPVELESCPTRAKYEWAVMPGHVVWRVLVSRYVFYARHLRRVQRPTNTTPIISTQITSALSRWHPTLKDSDGQWQQQGSGDTLDTSFDVSLCLGMFFFGFHSFHYYQLHYYYLGS